MTVEKYTLQPPLNANPTEINSIFQGIVKQMSNGVNATEILRGIIKPQHNEDVIQSAIKMASLPSVVASEAQSMNSSSRSATITTNAVSSGGSINSTNQNNKDKCPLLMELLYKSFQARLAKENRLKALQQISEQQQHHHAHEKSSSSLKPNHHSSAISALVAAAATAATVPTSHAAAAAHQVLLPVNANQTLATSAHTTATNNMEATVNPFPMSNPELMAAAAAAAALNQQQQAHHAAVAAHPPPQPPPPPPPPQQPQHSLAAAAASYPLFSYYMNPMWASTAAAQYFQHPATQSLMIPNIMQLGPTLTSQMAATAGVKRAAAPVLYPTTGALEKRMKLA